MVLLKSRVGCIFRLVCQSQYPKIARVIKATWDIQSPGWSRFFVGATFFSHQKLGDELVNGESVPDLIEKVETTTAIELVTSGFNDWNMSWGLHLPLTNTRSSKSGKVFSLIFYKGEAFLVVRCYSAEL